MVLNYIMQHFRTKNWAVIATVTKGEELYQWSVKTFWKHIESTCLDPSFLTTFMDLTFWFWLLLFLLWLPPELGWGVIHEALDHMGPNQCEATECTLLHHK